MLSATALLDFLKYQITPFPSALEVDVYHQVIDGESFYKELEAYLEVESEKEISTAFKAWEKANELFEEED